jgi:hypothetical protein
VDAYVGAQWAVILVVFLASLTPSGHSNAVLLGPQDRSLETVMPKCTPPTYKPPPDPDVVGLTWSKGKRYQLVIGADEYALSPSQNRPYVKETARIVSARLAELGYAPLPTLAAESEPYLVGAQASKPAIWRAVRELRKRAQAGDVAVIYYVGHGSITPSGADLCLATHDRPIDVDEGIRVSDIIGELSLAELRSNVREIPRIFLILDTCYAGNFLGNDGTVLTEEEGTRRLGRITSAYPTPDKVVILTATGQGSANRAYELSGSGMSALGFFFTRALKEDWPCADTTPDGVLTVRELHQHLGKRLQFAHKSALIEGLMRPQKRDMDENSFVAYDAARYSIDGDRGAIVELTAVSLPGRTGTLALPDGSSQTCAPRCTAVVSRSLEGNITLTSRAKVDMDSDSIPMGPFGIVMPKPPPSTNDTVSSDSVSVRDIVSKQHHVAKGITVTAK